MAKHEDKPTETPKTPDDRGAEGTPKTLETSTPTPAQSPGKMNARHPLDAPQLSGSPERYIPRGLDSISETEEWLGIDRSAPPVPELESPPEGTRPFRLWKIGGWLDPQGKHHAPRAILHLDKETAKKLYDAGMVIPYDPAMERRMRDPRVNLANFLDDVPPGGLTTDVEPLER